MVRGDQLFIFIFYIIILLGRDTTRGSRIFSMYWLRTACTTLRLVYSMHGTTTLPCTGCVQHVQHRLVYSIQCTKTTQEILKYILTLVTIYCLGWLLPGDVADRGAAAHVPHQRGGRLLGPPQTHGRQERDFRNHFFRNKVHLPIDVLELPNFSAGSQIKEL